jgi:hypothetical protein
VAWPAVSSPELCPTPALRPEACALPWRCTGRCRTNLNRCGPAKPPHDRPPSHQKQTAGTVSAWNRISSGDAFCRRKQDTYAADLLPTSSIVLQFLRDCGVGLSLLSDGRHYLGDFDLTPARRSSFAALYLRSPSSIVASMWSATRTTSLWFKSMPCVAQRTRSASMSCASASCIEKARLTTGLVWPVEVSRRSLGTLLDIGTLGR